MRRPGLAIVAVALATTGCGDPTVVSLALGGAHSVALDENGEVWTWGGASAVVPQAIDALPTATMIAAGNDHSCAVGSDGSLWCWGSGKSGQLGHGSTESAADPVAVNGLANVRGVATGDRHTCAIDGNDAVWCWGDNSTGQLGSNPDTETHPSPQRVNGVFADAISAGGIEGVSRTCITRGGKMSCWGRNETVTPVDTVESAISFDIGIDHFCAVHRDGELVCFGTVDQASVALLNMQRWTAVAAGGLHTCALSASGSVWCFGDNLNGQLGAGHEDATDTPIQTIASGATSIGAGTLHSCAVTGAGQVSCWGENNNGRVGNGQAGGVVATPTPVPGFGDN